MALWLVRAGKYGEEENLALDKDVVVHGWTIEKDLKNIKTKGEIQDLMQQTNPSAKPKSISNWANQVWAFLHKIKHGDCYGVTHLKAPRQAKKAHPLARKWNFFVDVYAVIDFFTIAAVLFSFGVSSSLHQSPIWIKASLMSLCVALSRSAGPENLRLLAVSKTGYHRSCGCQPAPGWLTARAVKMLITL